MFLTTVKSKFLSCSSMSDITLLSKFLFSVEPCHSLLPNANLIVHFFQARPSMFKHLSSYILILHLVTVIIKLLESNFFSSVTLIAECLSMRQIIVMGQAVVCLLSRTAYIYYIYICWDL